MLPKSLGYLAVFGTIPPNFIKYLWPCGDFVLVSIYILRITNIFGTKGD